MTKEKEQQILERMRRRASLLFQRKPSKWPESEPERHGVYSRYKVDRRDEGEVQLFI